MAPDGADVLAASGQIQLLPRLDVAARIEGPAIRSIDEGRHRRLVLVDEVAPQ